MNHKREREGERQRILLVNDLTILAKDVQGQGMRVVRDFIDCLTPERYEKERGGTPNLIRRCNFHDR
jgi:hypothetical protein